MQLYDQIVRFLFADLHMTTTLLTYTEQVVRAPLAAARQGNELQDDPERIETTTPTSCTVHHGTVLSSLVDAIS
jgi:hypothetical protein